jgi:hypothetical protein
MKSSLQCSSLLLLISLLLSGCLGGETWRWQHPDELTDQARLQAIVSCEQLADEEVRRNYAFYDYYPFPVYRSYSPQDRFFFRDHYFHYLNHRRMQDRNRYFHICMKAKGWKLVKLPEPQEKE